MRKNLSFVKSFKALPVVRQKQLLDLSRQLNQWLYEKKGVSPAQADSYFEKKVRGELMTYLVKTDNGRYDFDDPLTTMLNKAPLPSTKHESPAYYSTVIRHIQKNLDRYIVEG